MTQSKIAYYKLKWCLLITAHYQLDVIVILCCLYVSKRVQVVMKFPNLYRFFQQLHDQYYKV